MSEHNIISVSGGKDSTALLLLAIERQPENLQAVFADTGNEHELTYDYVRYLEQATGVPIRWVKADFSRQIAGKREYVLSKWADKGVPQSAIDRAAAALVPTGIPFLDLCIWKGRFPSAGAPFCSEELKRNPIIGQVQQPLLDAGDDIISWQGIRSDESLKRSKLTTNELKKAFSNGAEFWIYRPILDWKAEDCFAMHRKHGIKHNPLYEMGMGRVGCMPCINCKKNELLEISKRFPEAVDRIRQWEIAVGEAAKRGFSTFFNIESLGPGFQPHEYYEAENIVQIVEWAKTGRGGKQYDWLKTELDGPLCSSIYGLCE